MSCTRHGLAALIPYTYTQSYPEFCEFCQDTSASPQTADMIGAAEAAMLEIIALDCELLHLIQGPPHMCSCAQEWVYLTLAKIACS